MLPALGTRRWSAVAARPGRDRSRDHDLEVRGTGPDGPPAHPRHSVVWVSRMPASVGNPGGHRAEGPETQASKDRDVSARQLTLVL